MEQSLWLGKRGEKVMEVSARALRYDICDRCLGRLFARSGFGLTNPERGRSIRTFMGMASEVEDGEEHHLDDHLRRVLPVHGSHSNSRKSDPDPDTDGFKEPFPVQAGIEKGKCWLCQGIFDDIEKLVDVVTSSIEGLDFTTFQVGTRVDPETTAREAKLWEEVDPFSAEPLKEEMNRVVGKVLDRMWEKREVDRNDPEVTFILDPLFRSVDLQIKPIFVRGRYRKLERGIPQTRWVCRTCRGKGCRLCGGKGRMYETSVEEEIGPVLCEEAGGSDYKLHGMGREDIDVMTLGKGRPFILEITKPRKRTLDLSAAERRINREGRGLVEASGLVPAERGEIEPLKSAKVKKRYRAIISVEGGLDEEKLKYGISLLAQSPIKQRTPLRVTHRRADLVRERTVHEIEARSLGEERFEVTVLTDGGLYIKELLHGDGGRTVPSLSSALDLPVVVESLDVVDVLDETEYGR